METVDEANIITEPVESAVCPGCGAMLDVKGMAAFSKIKCPQCGREFPVPARFGPFLLLQLLGAGGMGGVYRAKDEGLNREIALKVMLKSLGDDKQFITTFQREAQAAAKLNHPHIAQIYSFGTEKGQPYIAMELVAGGSLDRMMAEQGPLDPALVIHVGEEIAEGLKEAADAGMIHGDVKPENILFDEEKNAKLVDFGLSAMQSGPGNDVWGTPYYIAPEKVRRQKSDYRADIYSLGGTLYHAIAGQPPFDGPDATAVVKARFTGPAKPLSSLRPSVPKEVDALIGRMLEPDPNMRYPTYGSLIGDMKRYLKTAGPVDIKSKSRKIIIKGKSAAITTGNLEPLPEGMTPVNPEDVPAEESAEVASRRGCRIMAMVVGGAILGLLAIAGGIVGLMHMTAVKAVKGEAAVILASQDKIRQGIKTYLPLTDEWIKKVDKLPEEAMGYCKEATDAVVASLGEETRQRLVPPEPDFAAMFKEETPTNAAAGTAPATNAVAKAGATNAPAAKAEAPAEVPAAEGSDSDSNSQLTVVNRVRDMYKDAYSVKGAVLYVHRMRDEIAALAASADKVSNPEEVTAEAIDSMKGAEKKLIEINKNLDTKYHNMSFTKQVQEAPRTVALLKKTLDSVKSDLSSLKAQQEEEKLAAEKKAAEAAKAAEAKKAESAEKEKVANELAKIAAAEDSNVEALKALDFRNASRVLKDLDEEITTEKGKDALVTARERVNRIEKFHEFMVEHAKGFKSPRGWTITDADKRSMTVGGQKIPWAEVYSKQARVVAEMIQGLINSPEAAKAMKLRERTQIMTDTALFLTVFYKDSEGSQTLAKSLATEAAKLFDLDADIIKQLLPKAFEE
jgi:serine/threonine protein kinase